MTPRETPILRTERLVLRPRRVDDADALHPGGRTARGVETHIGVRDTALYGLLAADWSARRR